MGTHTKTLARSLLFLLVISAGPGWAAKITCIPGANSGPSSAFNSIRRISIDEHSRTVNMDVVRSRTKDTETMGKMRADLVNMEESQSGEPIYVFNSIPTVGTEGTSLFRLFKTTEWYLLAASVTYVNKVPALKTVEQGVVFDCKRSDMG
jgi:hypothetical protein